MLIGRIKDTCLSLHKHKVKNTQLKDQWTRKGVQWVTAGVQVCLSRTRHNVIAVSAFTRTMNKNIEQKKKKTGPHPPLVWNAKALLKQMGPCLIILSMDFIFSVLSLYGPLPDCHVDVTPPTLMIPCSQHHCSFLWLAARGSCWENTPLPAPCKQQCPPQDFQLGICSWACVKGHRHTRFT